MREIFAAIFVGAAFVYWLHIGADPLGASEAYSAWAAAKPGVAAIVGTPVLHDPGKQVFYYIALHYYSELFGLNETSLRSMSAIFSLMTVLLVFALGREMFDEGTALAATAIWAFNPLAVAFAHTARMYPMLMAVALAQLLTLWRTRTRPSVSLAAMCGVAGAALLYTHLGGVLFIGTGAAMLVRDYLRGQRNRMGWLAMAITLALFVPYLPILREQSQAMVSGHWLDWIGTSYEYPFTVKLALSAIAAAVGAWFVVGAAPASDRDDRLRWLAAWTIIPGLALAAGSIAIRPMFNLRYVAPSLATLALLIAAGIALVSVKWRNLVAAGFTLFSLIVLPFDRTTPQPWPQIAGQVARGGTADPVFFEAGFVSQAGAPNIANGGFPFGFYSVPFNYYFSGANPRVAVPGFDPAAARTTIEQGVSAAGGGWLLSWKEGDAVNAELPDPKRFRVVKKLDGEHLGFYRITPVAK